MLLYDMKIYLPLLSLLSLSEIGKSCFDQAEGWLSRGTMAENDSSIPSYSRTLYQQNISYKSQEEKRKREKKT